MLSVLTVNASFPSLFHIFSQTSPLSRGDRLAQQQTMESWDIMLLWELEAAVVAILALNAMDKSTIVSGENRTSPQGQGTYLWGWNCYWADGTGRLAPSVCCGQCFPHSDSGEAPVALSGLHGICPSCGSLCSDYGGKAESCRPASELRCLHQEKSENVPCTGSGYTYVSPSSGSHGDFSHVLWLRPKGWQTPTPLSDSPWKEWALPSPVQCVMLLSSSGLVSVWRTLPCGSAEPREKPEVLQPPSRTRDLWEQNHT